MQMPALVSILGRCVLAAAAVSVVLAAAQAQSPSAAELANTLRQGGYVVVMRHANSPQTLPNATTATPGNTRLERQLNENGHKTAHAMGEALKTLRIPVGEVLASPTFRTRETVQDVGLGMPKTYNEIGDGSQGYELSSYEDGAQFMRTRVAEVPRAGTNTFIVTHLPNIEYAFGNAYSDVAEGEAVVFKPDGINWTAIGRITIDQWPRLAGQN